MRTVDTIIIGAGVVGASVAYHLTQAGCRDILLLEGASGPGQGSTGKATGGVRAQFETPINIQLSLYSLDFFRDWEHDCGYDPKGYLFLATEQRHMEYLRRAAEVQRGLGYSDVQILSAEDIPGRVTGLHCENVLGGSFGPRDGFIDPLAVLKGFLTRAVDMGAKAEYGVQVAKIDVLGGKVTGVTTASESIAAENVVLCTGAWARQLAGTAGVDLPVEPMRRQIAWAKSAKPLPPDLPMVIDMSDGFHFRPARGSRDELLFAFPNTDERPGFDTDVNEEFTEKICQRASRSADFLASSTVIPEKCRAGLYENTPDHHAILGKCEVEGLYLANGFSGHGVMHSPATGRALAEIICSGEASFMDVSSLSIDRFAKGELLHETAFI